MKRDIQVDEQISLPIETVYNSIADSLKSVRINGYYHEHDEYSNKQYFNYPPEWKTPNIGEKIIGVRNMTINWRDGDLSFRSFIRMFIKHKYHSEDGQYNGCTEEEIHQLIIDNMPEQSIRFFEIPVNIKVKPYYLCINIKDLIQEVINELNLYKNIKKRHDEPRYYKYI